MYIERVLKCLFVNSEAFASEFEESLKDLHFNITLSVISGSNHKLQYNVVPVYKGELWNLSN